MKGVLLLIARVVLLATMLLAFFSLTPWLGCRPLNELPSTQQQKVEVPADAVCFTDNHGRVAFHQHGLISQEPYRFVGHLIAFLLPAVLMILLDRRSRARSSSTN